MSTNIVRASQPFPEREISRRAALARAGVAVAAIAFAAPLAAADDKRKVVVWSEGTANVNPDSKNVYPKDINFAIAEGLKPLESQGWEIITASLNEPDQGLSENRVNSTDVLIWWGHKKHGEVKDDLVDKIVARVKEGKIGCIGAHSC